LHISVGFNFLGSAPSVTIDKVGYQRIEREVEVASDGCHVSPLESDLVFRLVEGGGEITWEIYLPYAARRRAYSS
jgi:hypothetical protein